MEKKINYQKLLEKELDFVKTLSNKPKLLLHVCCGPCSTIPLLQLDQYFDITLIYNNSNIYPREEYERRKNELIVFLKNNYPHIKVVFIDYDNESYNQLLKQYGPVKEGGDRCRACFRNRLNFGFEYAMKNGFDYFGTVMSISRYKNAQDLNKIGKELEVQYQPVKWLFADFKKNNGYEYSLLIIKENDMYLQEYCGCIYSYQKYLEKNEKKDSD